MPAPLPPYRYTVEADWTDYNGHLNVAFYVLVFDRATDAANEASAFELGTD